MLSELTRISPLQVLSTQPSMVVNNRLRRSRCVDNSCYNFRAAESLKRPI